MKGARLKRLVSLFKESFKGFGTFKIPKLSASLAYYTIFSMAPLLVVIIFICSLFFGREAIEGTINTQLQGFVGVDAAKQIEDLIKNASVSGKGPLAAIIGIITLVFGATTIFGEIQDSVDRIWGLKVKPKRGWLRLLKNRLLSFGIISSLGFLLLVSLAVTTLIEAFNTRLKNIFPDAAVVIFYVINLLVTLIVVSLIFAIIYKILPDAKIKWKTVWPGAILTAVLFMIGKFLISFYISKAHVGDTFGAAGSLVILLVWIYYSSFILYFGAVFTRNYAIQQEGPIKPSAYAVTVKEVETSK